MDIEKLLKLMNQRRSIRSFTKEEIPDDKLKLIAKAGRNSPTDSNRQLRKFTLVKNKELIQNLGQAIGQEIGIEEYNFYGATALLLISLPRDHKNASYEIALATQNCWLAATALDIGMAWIHQINGRSDQSNIRKVLNQLAIPEDHICLNALAIGLPAENLQPKEQTEEIKLFS